MGYGVMGCGLLVFEEFEEFEEFEQFEQFEQFRIKVV